MSTWDWITGASVFGIMLILAGHFITFSVHIASDETAPEESAANDD